MPVSITSALTSISASPISKKIWEEKLLRVEGVIDARLKHLEDPSQ